MVCMFEFLKLKELILIKFFFSGMFFVIIWSFLLVRLGMFGFGFL